MAKSTETSATEKLYIENRKALLQASEDMGGWESIAKALREAGQEKITRMHILGWTTNVKAGVPPEYLVVMEEITGIPRERLRQDIPWRDKAA